MRRPSGRAFGGLVVGALLLGSSLPAGGATTARTASTGGLLFPLPAAPALPSPCPPPPLPPAPPSGPLPAPVVPEADLPVPTPPPARHVNLAAVTGKGMWLTIWPGESIDAAAVVATARAAGLHQLWIRTGSSHDGFYGAPLLRALVPVAHAAGIDVIAWDFPTMSSPTLDARRAAEAAALGVDGFSPDIETAAEGTYLTARRVADYLALVRAALGDLPIIATVPRPLAGVTSSYPYAAEAPYVDVFAPMVYWSCTEPGAALTAAIAPLIKLRPVAPIGQDYNMASEGGRHGLPSAQEIWRFLDVARRAGALGASLYDLEAGGTQDLLALSRYPWSPTA